MEENSKKIYALIDYYSAVVDNCSINDVFEMFRLQPYYDQGEFAKLNQTWTFGGSVHKSFRQHGLLCGPRLIDWQYVNMSGQDVFSYKFEHLGISLSGSGLAELRAFHDVNSGFKLDDFLKRGYTYTDEQGFEPVPDSVYSFCDEVGASNYHVTRCDFAFDLVNYKPEFLDELTNYCRRSEEVTGSEQLHIIGYPGSPCFETQNGRKKVVYIGSRNGASDRLLRVYDKRKEYFNDGAWKESDPLVEQYDHPASWIRIELQLRREYAEKLLYSRPDPRYCVDNVDDDQRELLIFGYIYRLYRFRDLSHLKDNHVPVVATFWESLWNWAEIPGIIQNLHFVKDANPMASAWGSVRRSYRSQWSIAASKEFGIDFVRDDMADAYSYMIHNRDGIFSVYGINTYQSYLKSLLECNGYIPFRDMPGIYYRDDFEGVPLIKGIPLRTIQELKERGLLNNG